MFADTAAFEPRFGCSGRQAGYYPPFCSTIAQKRAAFKASLIETDFPGAVSLFDWQAAAGSSNRVPCLEVETATGHLKLPGRIYGAETGGDSFTPLLPVVGVLSGANTDSC